MKLSQYAKKVGATYRMAFQWWKDGQIKGYQMPSGTIMITEEEEANVRRPERVVIYARVSSHKQAPDLDRQVQRLLDYCAAKGYQVARSVKEMGQDSMLIVRNSWPCSRTRALSRLWWSTQIVLPDVDFGIFKPFSRCRSGGLRSSISQKPAEKTCLLT